jgi:hypothetical protein
MAEFLFEFLNIAPLEVRTFSNIAEISYPSLLSCIYTCQVELIKQSHR